MVRWHDAGDIAPVVGPLHLKVEVSQLLIPPAHAAAPPDSQAHGTGAALAGGELLRALRNSGVVARLYRRDRLSRFWFQDLRRLSLFLAMMRESEWLRGDEPGRFSLASLAVQAQMSVARTSQILSACAATGDFRRQWDSRDARYLVFEPSPSAREGFEELAAEVTRGAAALFRRPASVPTLGPDGLRRYHRAFAEHALACLSTCALDDRSHGSLTFLMAMADVALHSPIIGADFVRRGALRLGVTTVTMRNVIARAERGGWVTRSGRFLTMPEEGRCRVHAALEAVSQHASALLQAADGAMAEDRSAACAGAGPPR